MSDSVYRVHLLSLSERQAACKRPLLLDTRIIRMDAPRYEEPVPVSWSLDNLSVGTRVFFPSHYMAEPVGR